MSIIEKAISKLERAAGNKRTDRVGTEKSQRIVVDARNTIPRENDVMPNKQSSFAGSTSESVNSEPRNYVVIDLKRLNQLGIVTPDQGKTQIAEQFRIIKRPLLTKAFSKKNNNLIMITSALAGEGKSFCAVNLAMSIASEMDHRVLLIDADVGRPTMPNILGFENKIGLMDILIEDSVDVADVLIKTSIEKLSLISVGAMHPHATELLASQAMLMLLDELAQRYNDRIVIFDSPPVLLTSEARVLAERMGQIVLVVEAERTAQQTLKHVINQFGASSDISLIYNKDRTFSDNKYYGYYYS
jgi:receptor protein-tyrosine kinase